MLLIIFGLPGSGKSYFGEHLADNLNWEYINSDRVRKEFKMRGKYDPQDKQKVYEYMFEEAEKVIKQKKNIIIDATFSDPGHLKRAKALAQQLGTDYKLIEMKADEATIKARVSKERKYSEAGFEVYQKIKSEYETVNEPHLILDTSNTSVENLIAKAKQYLNYD
ncbi:ATP-binding protein [Catalinimonas sp. 4WD22]|uniref:AAA family ATPase n=1 Tax=Catalinimonas locisalis TaxID=3133978 RepID=UPI003101A2C4